MWQRCEYYPLEDDSSTLSFPTAGSFALSDRLMVQIYIDKYRPMSCEYNFANLFCWQAVNQYSWHLYMGRLVVYDGVSQCAFMPLGEVLTPEELAGLARHLLYTGLTPRIGLATRDYLAAFPQAERYFDIEARRDYGEYIYDVTRLAELNTPLLHKKKNLVSQFNRQYPHCQVVPFTSKIQGMAHQFARDQLFRRGRPSQGLLDEFSAMEKAFEHFDDLCLNGRALMVDDRMVAFAVFSRLNDTTYNVHFEKADISVKGAAQVINQETARYLSSRCRYINREQDLGIKGLRQAKKSYDPLEILIPHTLILKPV